MAIRFLKRRRPSRTAPVTGRAQILDGRHLWLALTSSVPGRLGVLSPSGEFVPLSGAAVPTGCSTPLTVPLEALPPTDQHLELVLESEDHRRHHHVLAAASARFEVPPTRTSRPPGERWQLEVTRGDADHVLVRRRPVAAATEVLAVGCTATGLLVSWADTPHVAHELLVQDDRGDVVRVIRGEDRAGVVTACIDTIPATSEKQLFSLATRGAAEAAPLERRRNDLARPQRSVLMPTVSSGGQRLSLSWHPSGRLMLQAAREDR